MVWLGFGVLVASLSYLIYRHPGALWPSCFQLSSKRRERGDDGTEPVMYEKEASREVSPPERDDKALRCGPARPSPSDPPLICDDTTSLALESTPEVTTTPVFSIQTPDAQNNTPNSMNNAPPQSQPTASSQPSPSTSMPPPPPPQAPPLKPTASTLMPPPRLKPPTMSVPPVPRPSNSAPLRPPPSAASSLRVPVTQVLRNTSMAPSPTPPISSSLSPSSAELPKKSRKVQLTPGHSPLDWAALKASSDSHLRGANLPSHFIRVPPSLLKQQNGRKGKDAWTVWQGKVYNITPYLPYHPGGEGELMRCAGKEAGKLFLEVHPWVNWEGLLNECLVGVLVAEGEERGKGGKLDEMD